MAMAAMRYYRCPACNLIFKNPAAAIDHKAATLHGDMKEEYFASRYDPFPPVDLGSFSQFPEVPAVEHTSIGEPADPQEIKEFYVCLTCRLTFKNRSSAAEHRANARHRVVGENYPIGPPHPAGFRKISKVRGSNIDYDAFFQRTIDDVPNEN